MARTRDRPLPSGQLGVMQVLIFACLLCVISMAVLVLWVNTLTAILTFLSLIGYAIVARSQRFPDETPYRYEPFEDAGLRYPWNDEARASLKDYNLLDMSI